MVTAGLSRREREVMQIVHRLGRATASQVRDAVEDPPTGAAVRSILRILVSKGHLRYESDGPRYVYHPTEATDAAGRSALQSLLQTFFDGSTEGAMAALIEIRGDLAPEEKERLKKLIDHAEEEGR